MDDTRHADPAAERRPPSQRHLVRSTSDRKIAGVAGGLGEYFGIDPTLFRLGLVIMALVGGSGVLLYLLAWVLLPEDGSAPSTGAAAGGGLLEGVSTIRLIAGGLLVLVGLASLVDLPRLGVVFPWSWPVIFIAAGLAVLLWSQRTESGAEPDTDTVPDHPTSGTGEPRPWSDPSPASAAPSAAAAPSSEVSRSLEEGGADAASIEPIPTGAADLPAGPATGGSGGAGAGPGEPAEPPSATPGGSGRLPAVRASATALTCGAIFLLWGVLALGHLAGWWTAGPEAVLGGALALTGAGLLASAWLGRGLLLIPLGVVFALLLPVAIWVDVPLAGGFGERRHVFTDPGQIEPTYELTAGDLRLDLTGTEIDRDIALDAAVGFGKVAIDVPGDVDLVIDARAGLGEVIVTDASGTEQHQDGVDAEVRRTVRPAGSDGDVVRIAADVGFGQVVIRQLEDTGRRADPPTSTPSSPRPPTSTPPSSRLPTSTPSSPRPPTSTLPARPSTSLAAGS